MRNRNVVLGGVAAFALSLSLAGCADQPIPPPKLVTTQQPAAIVSTETQQLTPEQVNQVMGTSTSDAYVLGPTDIISVTVYMHPELDVPIPNISGNVGGALVTSDGTVQLPLIGSVQLGGLTLDQAQRKLSTLYATYVNAPRVAVELQQAQSLRYYLLGAFETPGVKYPLHQLTLLDALALGGTVNIANADLYQAYVAQGSTKLPIDLHALLINGDMTQNVPLASGDAIVIPTTANENAFVFGSVTKPGAVPFEAGGLSLLQAMTVAGLDLPSITDGRLTRVHIIRAEGRNAEFIVVDARAIMEGNSAPFQLQPGDIVYIPPNGVGTWNQVIGALLPSLETVGAVLNPFVSIAYLTRTNGNN